MKSNIKRILSILLSLTAVLSLCACGAELSDSASSKVVTSFTDNAISDVSTSDSEIPSGTGSSVSSESSEVASASEDSSSTSSAEVSSKGYVDGPDKLKVISYNIRYANDGENKNISDRAPRLKAVVDKYDPDLFGLQEVTPTWRGILEDYFLDEYDWVFKERNSGDECTPIFWKKDKFEKVKEGYFWLSGTPDVQSNTWGGNCYRIVSWVRLKSKSTGNEFLYYNTHYDFGHEIQEKSSNLILQKAASEGAFTDYAMILTGDFNMRPNSDGYNVFTAEKMIDVNRKLGYDKTPTTNGYNEDLDTENGHRIIDYCFCDKTFVKPVTYKVLNEKINGGYVSDHRGVYVEIEVN